MPGDRKLEISATANTKGVKEFQRAIDELRRSAKGLSDIFKNVRFSNKDGGLGEFAKQMVRNQKEMEKFKKTTQDTMQALERLAARSADMQKKAYDNATRALERLQQRRKNVEESAYYDHNWEAKKRKLNSLDRQIGRKEASRMEAGEALGILGSSEGGLLGSLKGTGGLVTAIALAVSQGLKIASFETYAPLQYQAQGMSYQNSLFGRARSMDVSRLIGARMPGARAAKDLATDELGVQTDRWSFALNPVNWIPGIGKPTVAARAVWGSDDYMQSLRASRLNQAMQLTEQEGQIGGDIYSEMMAKAGMRASTGRQFNSLRYTGSGWERDGSWRWKGWGIGGEAARASLMGSMAPMIGSDMAGASMNDAARMLKLGLSHQGIGQMMFGTMAGAGGSRANMAEEQTKVLAKAFAAGLSDTTFLQKFADVISSSAFGQQGRVSGAGALSGFLADLVTEVGWHGKNKNGTARRIKPDMIGMNTAVGAIQGLNQWMSGGGDAYSQNIHAIVASDVLSKYNTAHGTNFGPIERRILEKTAFDSLLTGRSTSALNALHMNVKDIKGEYLQRALYSDVLSSVGMNVGLRGKLESAMKGGKFTDAFKNKDDMAAFAAYFGQRTGMDFDTSTMALKAMRRAEEGGYDKLSKQDRSIFKELQDRATLGPAELVMIERQEAAMAKLGTMLAKTFQTVGDQNVQQLQVIGTQIAVLIALQQTTDLNADDKNFVTTLLPTLLNSPNGKHATFSDIMRGINTGLASHRASVRAANAAGDAADEDSRRRGPQAPVSHPGGSDSFIPPKVR